jgi:ABC-2 type transport system permease protein
MIARQIRLEWRNLYADQTPLIAAILLIVAIAYGAYNGSRWVSFQRTAIQSALREERARLDEIRAEIPSLDRGEKQVMPFNDPRLPQSFGRNMGQRYAVMPPAALGSLAIGQSDLYPYYLKVSTNSKQTFVNSDELENPSNLLAGRFDLAFVILYLFPLVILAFSYNIVSADKEGGTLALALSQPVSLPLLVLAKIVPRAFFLFVLAVGLSAIGVAIGGADLTAEGALPRLFYWVGLTAGYGAFWFALAVSVNALGRSSAANAITLAGLWLLFVVVIPSVLNVVVKAAYPVPSRVEMIQAMRVAGEEATRKSSQLLARYMEDHPELAPARKESDTLHDFGTLLVAVNDATERSVQPVLEQFDRQVAAQQKIVDRFQYLSPAIVAQAGFNDLAGSSVHRYQHFLSQVDVYHRQWRGFLVPRILRKERLSVADIDRLPSFQFHEEDGGRVAARLSVGLLGLMLPLILVLFPAIRGLRKYPVAG